MLLVALPFLREPEVADDRLDAPTAAEEERLGLIEERDRALGALKELEFDHRAGKITDDDYRRDIGPLRRAAAGALRRLDDTPDLHPQPVTETNRGETMSEIQPVPEPTPPPDEGTLPIPDPVTEPYPPPDEADLPTIPQE
ncbi:MAG: hypothetical protein H0X39_06980 [Actinobacteria bacterium]|nr:hypothetical protein [Actinomycetota bacterium]